MHWIMEWHSTKFTDKINWETFDFLCWIFLVGCLLLENPSETCYLALHPDSINLRILSIFCLALVWCIGAQECSHPCARIRGCLIAHSECALERFPPGTGWAPGLKTKGQSCQGTESRQPSHFSSKLGSLFVLMILIFSIIAGIQCPVNFLLYSQVTQSHIHTYILILTLSCSITSD